MWGIRVIGTAMWAGSASHNRIGYMDDPAHCFVLLENLGDAKDLVAVQYSRPPTSRTHVHFGMIYQPTSQEPKLPFHRQQDGVLRSYRPGDEQTHQGLRRI